MTQPPITDEEIRQLRSSAAMGALTAPDAERLLDALAASRREARELRRQIGD